jgi:hypothetical protein
MQVELAADVAVFLEQVYLEAGAGELDGRGHAAEARADDDHPFSPPRDCRRLHIILKKNHLTIWM